MKILNFFVFGSTGAVGSMLFDILKVTEKSNIEFFLFTCNKNIEKINLLVENFKPKNIYISDFENIESSLINIDKNKLNKDKLVRNNLIKNEKNYIELLILNNNKILEDYYRNIDLKLFNFVENNQILTIDERLKLLEKIEKKENNQDNPIYSNIFFNSIMGYRGIIPAIVNFLFNNIIGASANKESMIILGELLKNNNINIQLSDYIFPLDSEHFSIYKLLKIINNKNFLKNIIITASGGIFYERLKNGFNFEDLANIKIDELLNHPNWRMGKRITIDSSTGLNKCFEFIEAIYLFNIEKEKIKIGVSKSSFIHGAVVDMSESLYLDASHPDMHQSINYFLRNILNLNTNYKYKELQNYFIDYKLEDYNYSFFKITDYIIKNYSFEKFTGTKLIILNELMQDRLINNEINLYQFVNYFIENLKKIDNIDIFENSFIEEFKKIIDSLYENVFSINYNYLQKFKGWLEEFVFSLDNYKDKLKNIIY